MKVLIKDKSEIKLKRLNEGVSAEYPKYKFSGVFTPCSYPGHTLKNRNNRIYQEDEVLKHIGYLRDKIKTDGCILGELDHPEGRFEVYLKEASHKIIDLWWDQKTHCVMGTLELLPTPNGKIAMELIESGYPLYVSSRSAGDVDKNTDEVIIYQIFTYDLVCTPGFAEAKLNRVNESFNPATVSYLNESMASLKKNKNKNLSSDFNLNQNTEVYKLDEEVELNDKIKLMKETDINIKEISKPILESEEKKEKPVIKANKKSKKEEVEECDGKNCKPGEAPTPKQLDDDNAESVGLEFRDTTPAGNMAKEESNNDVYAHHLNDGDGSDGDKKHDLVLDITVKEKGEEDSKSEKDEEKSDDNEDKKSEVLDITANKGSESNEKEDKEDDSEDEKEDKEDKEEDEKKAEEAAKKFKNKADQVEKKIDSKIDKYKDLLNAVDAKKKVKESIYAQWPFSVSLSESNFGKFCQLNAEDRTKCATFIFEHQIYDIEQINELFMTPLQEEKLFQKNWLRLADQEYIDLYTRSPKAVQDAIEESAKFLILETKADVDEFWRRTGLMEQSMQSEANAKFIEQYKAAVNPDEKNDINGSGYSQEFIDIVESWM